jgi:hypothetical protein
MESSFITVESVEKFFKKVDSEDIVGCGIKISQNNSGGKS